MATPPELLRRFFIWLTALQARRPWLLLGFAFLSLLPAAYAISGLKVRTAFGELLPDDKPSVVEMRRVSDRLASATTLTVIAESQNTALLKRFVDEMTPKFRELPRELVSAVDPGPADAQRFEAHAQTKTLETA